MSGASDTRDPIAAAKRDIAGSKDLMATVARDLGQHERWLVHYERAEKHHARRIRLQALIDRLKLRLWRLLRWSKRLALISLRLARSAAASLARTGARLVADSGRRTKEGAVWLRPRVHALYGTLRRWLTASWGRILSQSRILADFTVSASSTGFAWLAAQSRALAIALQPRLTDFGARARLQAARLTRASIDGAAIGFTWAAVRAPAQLRGSPLRGSREFLSGIAAWTAGRVRILLRYSATAASSALSWTGLNARRLWLLAKAKRGSVAHRALVVRQNTALIRFEPKRVHPPALRAS